MVVKRLGPAVCFGCFRAAARTDLPALQRVAPGGAGGNVAL